MHFASITFFNISARYPQEACSLAITIASVVILVRSLDEESGTIEYASDANATYDLIFAGLFLIEILVRYFASRARIAQFLCKPLHLIDLFSIFSVIAVFASDTRFRLLAVLRVIRAVRLVRIPALLRRQMRSQMQSNAFSGRECTFPAPIVIFLSRFP